MPEQVQANPTNTQGKVEGRYNELEQRRNPYLLRAWDCAELTIPSLLPRKGTTDTTNLPVPWQSIGARGVNNLASKLLMSTLPTNTPFFRQKIEDFTLEEMKRDVQDEQAAQEIQSKMEEALAKVERAVMSHIEMSTDRVSVFEAYKHLLVTGNVLLFNDPKKGMKVFSLNQYVVRRDKSGEVLEIVIKEMIDPLLLPDSLKAKVKGEPKGNTEFVCLYTYILRGEKNWTVYQEALGEEIPGTRSTQPLDKQYWLPLRFIKIDGEHYGRGYVESMLGDLRSLEALQRAIVEGSAAAAKILFLVKPNGTTKPKTLAEAPNGGIVNGNAEEVTTLQLEKQADFQIAFKLLEELTQSISLSFLMNTAIQRDAERVTAEEVRFMAEELEKTLGGFYTVLAVEFQIPYVRMKMDEMQRKDLLPKLPKGTIKTTIVTGLEALGRGHELAKLNTWIQGVIATWGPEVAAQKLNVDEIETRRAVALGIDYKGLLLTQEQQAANAQTAQQAQLGQTVAPHVVGAAGKLMQEGMKQNAGAAGQASQGQ